MSPPHHEILPDTPANREKLLKAFPDYTHIPPERRPAPCFLIMRKGVIGWVTGADADGAWLIIAQYSPRTTPLITMINAPRGDVQLR